MAKVALLIGVSEYKDGFARLPAATKDIEAMQGVLDNPKIGDFDCIKKLANPDVQSMREEIETLFSDLQKDDLVLLYFSGHGIKDDYGNLYFATCDTRKNNRGELLTSTAVQASFVHNIMDKSRSKRQVLILDCCFSGAFANGLNAKSDRFVDIKNQLGGEGRAILTSSTSTQYSFEEQGSDISTYTRYIVEGLETGAADKDEDAWISVDELHEYARTKVQEVAPAMKPEIYAIKEGYKITLAQAPIDDPKFIYRKEVEYWAKMGEGEISSTGYITLEELRERWSLTLEEANQIQLEVLEPYEINQKKLQRYKEAYCKAVEHEFPLNNKTRNGLKRLQEVLGLRDEDIALIEASISKYKKNPSKFRKWLWLLLPPIVGSITASIFMIRDISSQRSKLDREMSLGEDILFKQDINSLDINSNKQNGIKEFANSNFQSAIDFFKKYLQYNPDDPEALIYKNNALAAKTTPTLKIAVSVPIGTNPTVAKEILRGVAQRQNEINLKGGINGRLLQVLIANDDNDAKDLVKKIAQKLVADTDILAVVGHNSSDASIAGNLVYSDTELVAITPTSDAATVKDRGILHTMPPIFTSVDKLINNVEDQGLTKIAICYDSGAKASITLKRRFQESIKRRSEESISGKKITDVTPNGGCDLEKLDLKDNLPQAITASEVEALVLLPNVNHIDRAIKMAKAVKQKRKDIILLGSPTMNTPEILKENGSTLNGMLVSIPWNPEHQSAKLFVDNAQKLWSKQNWRPNWRTAMAYDATDAVVKGLEQEQNRSELKKIFKQSNFSINGVTGIINLPKGGDGSRVTLLQVKAKQTTVYEFEKVN
ncbi:MAG: caspase family protein [Calothrix sp. MO_192.B10]|nr:caspase family protein [Calothrix sp. MO_192.B10]